jgi:hypothetical protein
MWIKNILKNLHTQLQQLILVLLLILQPQLLILVLIIVNEKIRQSLTSVSV